MADMSALGSDLDISKLKVQDLKKELKTRGLNISGNKIELIERLQAALKSTERASNESVDDFDEDLLNEDDDDVHLETAEAESVISDIDTSLINDSLPPKGHKRTSDEHEKDAQDKPPVKKVVLNRNTPLFTETRVSTESKEDSTNGSTDDKKVVKLSGLSAKERLELRAKKFSVAAMSNEAKKLVRAERFGTQNQNISENKVDTSVDVLKKRAERFGTSVSKAMVTIDQKEKLEKRKARFGITSTEEKAKQRLERFKQPV